VSLMRRHRVPPEHLIFVTPNMCALIFASKTAAP